MSDDPIEDLLKATGKRPAVPGNRRDRVRAAVQDVWTAEVATGARRRRMRRVLWLSAAGLLLAVGAIALGWPFGAQPASGLTVAFAGGDAWAEHGPWIDRTADAVRGGASVVAGATVTTDTHAKVALTDPAGRSIRLDGGTALRVVTATSLVLTRGAVYIDAGTGPRHGELKIETPFGTLEDVGTQFQARLDAGELVVRVREGRVTLRGQARPMTAEAGQLIVADSGKFRVADDPKRAEGWDWIEAAAPMMAIEGRSLAEFVAWAARERGVTVRWAEPVLEAKASSIALHGSIEGMTLEQALTSVSATTGVDFRWREGEVVVDFAVTVARTR